MHNQIDVTKLMHNQIGYNQIDYNPVAYDLIFDCVSSARVLVAFDET